MKALALFLAGVALGFAIGRGGSDPFVGVVCASIAGALVGAFAIATFVVVQVGRIEGRAQACHTPPTQETSRG
jgi:hypothetical protein